MKGVIHDQFDNYLVKLLSKQSYFTVLPFHGYEILRSLVLFTSISWASYYIFAPRLIKMLQQKKNKDDGHTRAKWGHMLVSFIHAVIVTVWSLYLWNDDSLTRTVETRVLGYASRFGHLASFTLGYFIWDVFCCIWYLKHYGKGFLIHAFLGAIGNLWCFKPFMLYATSRFLLFEASTIFLDIHWFLEKLGYGSGVMMMLNDLLALCTYFGFRLCFGLYLSYKFLGDLWAMWAHVPLLFSLVFLALNVTTHSLNFYWFTKLAKAAIRSLSKAKPTLTDTTTIYSPLKNNKTATITKRTKKEQA